MIINEILEPLSKSHDFQQVTSAEKSLEDLSSQIPAYCEFANLTIEVFFP